MLERPAPGCYLHPQRVARCLHIPSACFPVVTVVSHRGENLYSAYIVAPQSWGALKSRTRHRMILMKMLTVKMRLSVHIVGWGLNPTATNTVVVTTSTMIGAQENGFSHTPTKASAPLQAAAPGLYRHSLTETWPCFENTFLNYGDSSYLQKVNNTLILLPRDRS